MLDRCHEPLCLECLVPVVKTDDLVAVGTVQREVIPVRPANGHVDHVLLMDAQTVGVKQEQLTL